MRCAPCVTASGGKSFSRPLAFLYQRRHAPVLLSCDRHDGEDMTPEQRKPTMTRMRRTSRTRRETAETTSARAKVKGTEKREAARYAGAFARVRLVRAWIAAVAAIASMVSPYV